MTAIHERHRNNVKAGIFMTIAVGLTLIVIAILQNTWETIFTPRHEYSILFTVKEGVQSLAPGSSVRVGGLEMGEVVDVQLAGVTEGMVVAEGQAESFENIVVRIELDSRVPLYSNAQAFVKGALIGADAWIEIASVGWPEDRDEDGLPDGTVLQPDDPSTPLRGRDAGTLLASLLGPEGAEKTDRILSDIAEFTPFLANIEDEYDRRIVPTLDNINQASVDVRDLAARISNEDWPRWAASVDRVLENAETTSQSLEQGVEEGRQLIANANAGVDDIRSTVNDNRPDVDQFIDNINAASADVRNVADRIANETMEKFDGLIARAQEGLDSFANLGADLEQEFDILAPQLRDAMASASNAANELALGTAEIRHSPWRLLYRPGTDELEYENLYFAATRFAMAASELKVATQSMERSLASHREHLQQNPEKLEELQNRLLESYQRYESAQRDLLDILAIDGGSGQ